MLATTHLYYSEQKANLHLHGNERISFDKSDYESEVRGMQVKASVSLESNFLAESDSARVLRATM